MQREIRDNAHLGQTVSVFDSVDGVSSINRTASDFDTAREKVKKLNSRYNTRYIPGTLDLVYQGMIDKIRTIEQPAHPSYKDNETFDFQLLLNKNQHTNLNSLHICFPIRFRKAANATAAIDATMAPVNNFFAHWVKELDITKYGTNKQSIPTSASQEIYQYSDTMLKHLPAKYLKKLRKHFLFREKEVIYTANVDRRPMMMTMVKEVTIT